MAEWLTGLNEAIGGFVWGIPMMSVMMAIGVWFSFRTDFVQVRRFGYAMRSTVGRCLRPPKARAGSVTPGQALTTALAATVGTGNIAGVAGAIALGGPGAVFWMWVSALLGMATKYAEVTLAIRFRERGAGGDWVGGPMYYIKNGLGRRWRWLAELFACCGAAAAFGIGNMTQTNTIADSVVTAAAGWFPDAAAQEGSIRLMVGIAVAAVAALVLLGGVSRLGAVTERLVPIAAALYVLAALAVLATHARALVPALAQIVRGAFCPSAMGGGLAGAGIGSAIRHGVGRGVFSNEAGLGSAPIAHAAADTDSPVRQGLFGLFEVFADTIVICTLTALAILTSGVPVAYGQPAGAALTIRAFAATFGDRWAGLLVAAGVVLFAVSTVLSWGLYGTRCAEFLFGARSVRPYQTVFLFFTAAGALMDLRQAWAAADTLCGLMAVPNLIALLALSGTVTRLTREFFGTKGRCVPRR